MKAKQTSKYEFHVYCPKRKRVVAFLKFFGQSKSYELDKELCWCEDGCSIPAELVRECFNVVRAKQILVNKNMLGAAETAYTDGKYFTVEDISCGAIDAFEGRRNVGLNRRDPSQA